jgi:hypothetical protein
MPGEELPAELDLTEREPRAIDRSCKRCLISGILSMAIPLSGVVVVLLTAFVLPSRYLNNELGEALRIYYGLAFLLPVPLGAVALAFFISGMRRLRRDPSRRGRPAAVAGLAISAVSATLYLLVLAFLPAF